MAPKIVTATYSLVLFLSSSYCEASVDIVPIACEAPSNTSQLELSANDHLPCDSASEYLAMAVGHILNEYAYEEGMLDERYSLPYPDFSDVWWERDASVTDDWHDDYLGDDQADDDKNDGKDDKGRRRLFSTDEESIDIERYGKLHGSLEKERRVSARDSKLIETTIHRQHVRRRLYSAPCYKRCNTRCPRPIPGTNCMFLWCGWCRSRRRNLHSSKNNNRKMHANDGIRSLAELATDELRSIAISGTITDTACLRYLNTAVCVEQDS